MEHEKLYEGAVNRLARVTSAIETALNVIDSSTKAAILLSKVLTHNVREFGIETLSKNIESGREELISELKESITELKNYFKKNFSELDDQIEGRAKEIADDTEPHETFISLCNIFGEAHVAAMAIYKSRDINIDELQKVEDFISENRVNKDYTY